MSAACAKRTSSISIAAIGFDAMRVSDIPFRSICQTRLRSRRESFSTRSRAHASPCAPKDIEARIFSPASGARRSRVSQCARSARSASIAIGSAPTSYSPRPMSMASFALPSINASNMSHTRIWSARPSMSRTTSSSTFSAPCAIAWSSSERASRAEPSAARASIESAPGESVIFSLPATPSNNFVISSASRRRKSKRWQRDNIVTGTLRISVVAKINFTCPGGSSSVFSKPLKAAVESMCTSSMM